MTLQNNLTQSMGGEVAMPQSANEVSQVMASKELARVQGQVFMAKQFPRDFYTVNNRISASCERVSLAEISEYEYSRGGQKIVGASIRLLEVIAQCYGNISYSWKEISRDMTNHKSTVLAYAWDLETNLYSEMEFDVYHYRSTKAKGRFLLTDDRDIYELIANQAARRVRRCLENVIPRDIVDDAREKCHKTLETKIDVQKELDKAIDIMNERYGVTLQQIEKRFGMNRRGFTANTYRELKRINVSIREGMASVEDYFLKEEESDKKAIKNELPKEVKSKQAKKEEQTEKVQEDIEQPTLL